MSSHHTARFRRALSPLGPRRPGVLLAAAAAGGVLVSVLATGEPTAAAETADAGASVSVAQALGIDGVAPAAASSPDLSALGDLSASRSARGAEAFGAAQAQQAADQAELDRRAAEAAAAEQAAREAAEAQAAAAPPAAAEARAAEEARAAAASAPAAPAPSRPAAPSSSSSSSSSSSGGSGSFKDYALAQVGSASEFACLERLWGRESGWNPSAQNPSSTAYGIPQFLDSTWAGTGIAKTSDGYRQIDAGLIYIDRRYGSPCGAWAHSQSTGWY